MQGIPSTRQNTDAHVVTSPPLGGHKGIWGKRVVGEIPVLELIGSSCLVAKFEINSWLET